MIFKNKIYSNLDQVVEKVKELKEERKTIVFTNGCFDVLHLGHVTYLEKARSLGDVLVVGLNSDTSVNRLKGDGRPVKNESNRTAVLAAFQSVDIVVVFGEDTPIKLIEAVVPDLLVKGGDYKLEEIVGADFVVDNGGEVLTIDFVEGYSTTDILNKNNKR